MRNLPEFYPYNEPLVTKLQLERLKHLKIVKHWGVICLACVAFGIALYLAEKVTAGLILGRVIDAIGDICLDRGVNTVEEVEKGIEEVAESM